MGVQLVLFLTFIMFFFSMEHNRSSELHDMQGELHRLRSENARQSLRLLDANKRMIRYEQDIRAELDTQNGAVNPDADRWDFGGNGGYRDGNDNYDGGNRTWDDDFSVEGGGAEEQEQLQQLQVLAKEDNGFAATEGDAAANELNHGSIAPAAHIEPVAAARASSDDGSSRARDHLEREQQEDGAGHAHPTGGVMPSAAADEQAASAMPALLRGRCLDLTHDYWTYELCFGGKIRQFHRRGPHDGPADPTVPDSFTLGSYVRAAEGASAGYSLQRYRGGDLCNVGTERRSVEVLLRCEGESLILASVTEPATCHYLLNVDYPRDRCDELKPGGGGGSSSSSSGGGGAAAAAAAAAAMTPPTAAAATAGGAFLWGGGAAAAAAAAPGTAAMPADASSARELSVSELHGLDVGGGAESEAKRVAVIHAIRHAWSGYERKAFGYDEVKPLSGGRNDWIGLGLTILDSLDVLWMAGLKAQYARAAVWVRNTLSFDRLKQVSFFETTIRCLGGLVAAYELSGDAVFLTKAGDLGERLGRAFASPAGLPYTTINLASGAHTVPAWLGGNVLLAEVGTVQLEFASLAAHDASKAHLRAKSDKVFDLLDEKGPPKSADGGRLWPIHVRPDSGATVGGVISWGAMGDSYYEYLLKYWLYTGKKHERYKRMYLEATRGMISKLVHVEGDFTFVAESKRGLVDKKMDHLVCFVPGMLALGAQHIPEVRAEHMALAEKLAHTCYRMYSQQKTGLAPEFVRFSAGRMNVGAAHNLLRPEAIESIFYMWRFTKDVKYREWGWKMFLAFQKYTRVDGGGYAGLKNVNLENGPREDKMETFMLAETLKYFLLLFSDDALLNLETHVLNTEAHPLLVQTRG